MRTCQSCGAQNPMDQDFCSCGEYLRWEPTGFMQAVTPEMAAAGTPPEPPEAPAAPPPPPPPGAASVTPAAPVQPEGGNGNGHQVPAAPPPPPPTAAQVPAIQGSHPPQQQPVPAQPIVRTLIYGAVPPPGAAAQPSPGEPATIVLRAPDGDPA